MTAAEAKARLAAHPVLRVAVLQTAFLGDVVFTSPLVRALKRKHPAAKLTLIVAPRGKVIAEHMPHVDSVLVFDKRGAQKGLRDAFRLGSELCTDLLVVPHPSMRSAAVSLGARGAVRVGPATFPERLAYDLAVDMGRGPFVQRMLTLARALGADATPDLHLTVTEAERKQARSELGPGLFAACVIGSEWETKRLPPASWAVVLDGLLAKGLTPILLGAPKEAPLAEEALKLTAGRARVRSLVGNSIEASLGLMAQSQVVLGGDTGLVHAARALGVPVVAFFGPTDPKVHLWEPASDVLALKLPCQPCDGHGPRVCPLGHHDCLKKLPPGDLLARAVERAGKVGL